MAENSEIEWTDHTFNPWIGCTKVSPGCDHCYAERREDKRLHRVRWGAGQPRQRTKTWGDPERWNKAHDAFFAQYGRRQRVFCASLADVFDNEVDPAWRADLFRLISETPNLDWLLLTKRIGNAARMMFEARGGHLPLQNAWLGATVVNQDEADRDIPKLLATPAAKRFLSIEPMLGPIDLKRLLHYDTGRTIRGIDWVICGGESGPGARPMHPDWARALRDQCTAAGVAFFFKQWGEWAPGSTYNIAQRTAAVAHDGRVAPNGRSVTDYPNGATSADGWSMVHWAGKKTAGRQLDGREWNEVPS